MAKRELLCPNCGKALAPSGINSHKVNVYQCGHCLMRGGTLREMTTRAVERKARMDATASLFKCKICSNTVPSTKINIVDTFPDAMLEVIHACDDCVPVVQMAEAKRKIDWYDGLKQGKATKTEWRKWYDGFEKKYQFKPMIRVLLLKEKKIDR
jgi:hypothetical protein